MEKTQKDTRCCNISWQYLRDYIQEDNWCCNILIMFQGLNTEYQVQYIYIDLSNILGIRSVHTRCYNILVMFQVLEFDTTILNIPGVKLVVLQYVGDVSEREKSETE